MRLLAILSALVLGAALAAPSDCGEDPAAPPVSREEQVRRIRQLPPEEQRRLKEALDRFRALPPAEREALRSKAKEVGVERLGELAGRDVEKLKERHLGIQREMDEVMRLLGGPQRLADLSDDERAYVRDQALRGFQSYVRLQLLEGIGQPGNFAALLPAERKERMNRAMDAMFRTLLDEKAPEEKARILALPPAEQRRERAKLFGDWRLRQTVGFVRQFDRFRLYKLLQLPAAERRAQLDKRVRWFQITSILHADGAQADTLRMLGQLNADERAQVSFEYEQAHDLPPAERRVRVETKIRELYGRSAFDPERPRRAHPLVDILRERRQQNASPPR